MHCHWFLRAIIHISSSQTIPYVLVCFSITSYSQCIGPPRRPRIVCCQINKAHQLYRLVNQIRLIVVHRKAVLPYTMAAAKLNGAPRTRMLPINSEIMKSKFNSIKYAIYSKIRNENKQITTAFWFLMIKESLINKIINYYNIIRTIINSSICIIDWCYIHKSKMRKKT